VITGSSGLDACELHSQTSAASGTTCRKYFTAIFRGHTSTETVGAFALQDAWLKGSFHGGESATEYSGALTGLVKRARNSIDFRASVQTTINVTVVWPFMTVRPLVV